MEQIIGDPDLRAEVSAEIASAQAWARSVDDDLRNRSLGRNLAHSPHFQELSDAVLSSHAEMTLVVYLLQDAAAALDVFNFDVSVASAGDKF